MEGEKLMTGTVFTDNIVSVLMRLNIGAVVFGMLLGLLVVVLISVLSQRKQVVKNKNIPDGSMGWPLIGETLDYLKPHPSNSLGHFLKQHCARYGRVFKSHLFGGPTVVSCDVELNEFILQNEGKLFASCYPKQMHDILGRLSILLVEGELHRKLRGIAVNRIGTSKSRLDFLHFVDKLSSSLIDSWRKPEQTLLFCQQAKQFTLHVMLKSLIDMEPEDPLAPIILKDFQTFMKGFISLPLRVPGSPYTKAMKARARIASTLSLIVEERKKSKLVGQPNSTPSSSRGDFLDEILEKDKLNDEERISILMDLLLAGYETTAGLVSLVVYFLWQAPKALQRSRVINEALRCGNLVKLVHRKALKDVKFKEYLIPRGWKVFPILSAAHLDSSLHQHPSLFNPWRWEDEATIKKVMPFGGGPRLCPGAELARLETSFFLHHFVLSYSWKIQDDDCPLSFPYLEFRRGLLLEIEPVKEK